MDALQDALQKLLSDPQQLSELAALAETLGLSPQNTPQPPERPEPPPPVKEPPTALPAAPFDARQERLLLALKPFLKPARQRKLDRALRLASLTRLAGSALRGKD